MGVVNYKSVRLLQHGKKKNHVVYIFIRVFVSTSWVKLITIVVSLCVLPSRCKDQRPSCTFNVRIHHNRLIYNRGEDGGETVVTGTHCFTPV